VVDWSHPLSGGLVGCFPFNEGQGFISQNLAGNREQLVQTGAAPWRSTSAGIGIETKGSSTQWIASNPGPALKPANTVSIFWRGIILGGKTGGVNNPYIFGMAFAATNTSPYCCYGFIRPNAADTTIGCWVNDGALRQDAFALAIPSSVVGVPISLLQTYDRSSANILYVNGALFGSTAVSRTAITYGATSNITVGRFPATADTPNAHHIAGYIWNRVLSPAEAMQIHNEPFSMLRGPDVYRR
jgi:hypothetical protein